MPQMNERAKELKALCAEEFAAWDMHLYLDTHPGDLKMVEKYNMHKMKCAVMRHDFEEKYYYLTARDAQGVQWFREPWPWDNEECGC